MGNRPRPRGWRRQSRAALATGHGACCVTPGDGRGCQVGPMAWAGHAWGGGQRSPGARQGGTPRNPTEQSRGGEAAFCAEPDEQRGRPSPGRLQGPVASPGSAAGGGRRRETVGGGFPSLLAVPTSSRGARKQEAKEATVWEERNFHVPCEPICFQERGKKISPAPTQQGSEALPPPTRPSSTSLGAAERERGSRRPCPAPLLPRPLRSPHRRPQG